VLARIRTDVFDIAEPKPKVGRRAAADSWTGNCPPVSVCRLMRPVAVPSALPPPILVSSVRLTFSAKTYILSLEDDAVKSRMEIERTLRRHLPELRRQFKVRRIGVFGSVVRGQQQGRSDLDILVEYSETPSLLAIVALKRHLTELTGEKVDLVPASALKPGYRQAILDEVVYA
jgi:predicted nucleotidyltransferase